MATLFGHHSPRRHRNYHVMTEKLSREDWTKLGLHLLSQQGPDGLTVDALCKAAKKTRGSLYHHFKDMPAVHKGVVEYWQYTNTTKVIFEVEKSKDKSPLYHLNDLAQALDINVEKNIRLLVSKHPDLQPMVNEVDTQRICFLAKLYEQHHSIEQQQAKAIAQIEYATWVGFQYLEIKDDKLLNQLYSTFEAMVEAYKAQN